MPPKVLVRAATPRELRRAFGPRAAEALNSHADAIDELNKQVGELSSDREFVAERFGHFDNALIALQAVRNRSFLGRLRWLVLGT